MMIKLFSCLFLLLCGVMTAHPSFDINSKGFEDERGYNRRARNGVNYIAESDTEIMRRLPRSQAIAFVNERLRTISSQEDQRAFLM